MQSTWEPIPGELLGVTAVDLYIPILTFVFGEAQIGGPCGLVSLPPATGILWASAGPRILSNGF